MDRIGYDESETTLREATGTVEATSPLALEHRPERCIVVLFGVTGDLASRKLIPALYDLGCHNVLPRGLSIVVTEAVGKAHPLHDAAVVPQRLEVR